MKHEYKKLGDLLSPAPIKRAGDREYPILSITMRSGLIDQSKKFKKRVASRDTSQYRVVAHGQLVVGFPIDEGLLSFQRLHPEAAVSPAYGIWDCVPGIEKEYLELYLRSPRAISYYKAKMKGSTARRRNLTKGDFLNLPVPVFSGVQQRNIVESIKKTKSLQINRGRSVELLDELTQSIFLEMFGDPRAPGSQWESVNFSEALTASPRNGLSPSKGGGFSASVLTLSSVTGESFNPDAQKEATFKEAPPSGKSVRRNDFLVCRGNGNVDLVGRGYFPTEDMPNVTFPDTIIASPVDQGKLSPKFLETLWKQNSTREQIKSVARTTNGTFKINQRSLESIKIIIPPISLQWEFSEKVRKIEEAKKKYQAHLAHLDELFSSVQQRAFDGTLWDDSDIAS